MYLGAHVGIAGGLPEAVRDGKGIGCEALQIFSKSPQMWAGPAIAPEAAEAFRSEVVTQGIRATAVHHGYLINLGSPKAFMLRRSRKAFLDEIQRAELLGVDALIFHPGAHLGSGIDTGLRVVAESLTKALDATPDGRVRLLLENAAGQGTALCSNFRELRQAIDLVNRPDRVGVTLDTCHLFASGVDLRTDEGYGAFMDGLRTDLGTEWVRAFHLNDAKAGLGSHLDRHENIGKGEIGTAGFKRLLRDATWDDCPGYLETPLDDRGLEQYREDLGTLRSLLEATPPTPLKTPTKSTTRAGRTASAPR